jgi:hypothetical protein
VQPELQTLKSKECAEVGGGTHTLLKLKIEFTAAKQAPLAEAQKSV